MISADIFNYFKLYKYFHVLSYFDSFHNVTLCDVWLSIHRYTNMIDFLFQSKYFQILLIEVIVKGAVAEKFIMKDDNGSDL